MPPKKATAAAKAAPKAKAVKKKAEKEEVDVEPKEVPEKKARKATKKIEEPKEEKVQVDKEEEAPQKKAKATKAAGTSKKGKTEKAEDDAPNEKENGTVKKRGAKSKKTKEETPEPVEEKKPAAPRGRRAKKTEEPEEEVEPQAEVELPTEVDPQVEEEASDSKKGRKRKAAPKEKKEPKSDEPAVKTKANATATNWEAINFKCSTKNSKGETPNFHITSWNVDGLRAWLKKGGLDILQYDEPDILCLQETKCSEEKLPEEITDLDGYELLWCCSDKEGYAGVGIATKVKPLSVTYGIESEEHDDEGRCITAEYEKFFLVNVYVPNAGRKLVTLPKRLEWNKLFKAYIQKLDERKPVIVCGDMNVAHTEIDLANPKTNTKNAGFTVEEREGMTDFLEDGYVDTFRRLYPDKEKAYTFWTYMANARTKNTGWRLDYFLVSDRLMENVCDNIIHDGVLGSDHCPIALHLNI